MYILDDGILISSFFFTDQRTAGTFVTLSKSVLLIFEKILYSITNWDHELHDVFLVFEGCSWFHF